MPIFESCSDAWSPRRRVPPVTEMSEVERSAVPPFKINFSIVYLPVPVCVKSGVPGVLEVTSTVGPVYGVAVEFFS